LVTRSYRDSFYGLNTRPHVGLATARAGNVIGGGDWSTDRLVPDAMRAFLAGDKLTVRFPNARRPWQHVLEPLSGYLILCEKLWADPLRFSSGWNFGPEQHGVTTVAELSQLLAASYGSGAKWNQIQKDDNLHEAELLQLDISKAKTKLGWRPYWDLETAVERTVEWYKSFDSGMDIKQITVEQLSGYNGINI